MAINPPARLKKYSRVAFSYAVALACLAWIFRDVAVRDIAHSATGLKWGLIAAGIGFDVLSYVFQALRWAELLRPVGRPSLARLVQAIYAGLLTSEMLPMRLGELVRAYLVSRTMAVGLVSALPSMAVERLLDAIWLALALGLLAFLSPLPKGLVRLADVFGSLVGILTLTFLFIVIRARSTAGDTSAAARSRGPILDPVVRAVRFAVVETGKIRLNRSFCKASLFSLLLLASQALSFWLVIRASGTSLTFFAGAAVMLIVRLGTAVPNAPANVGSYQFFCVIGLQMFGIDKPRAAGLSFLIFLVLTAPLWLLGWIALARSELSLSQIRKGLIRAKAQLEEARRC
ncbi:MAG: lysylphosphatidylglycerol synthase transmembrane domain-containing protein [Acidobacteriota bacterium]